MKTRVEYLTGSATRIGTSKVQVSFRYLEDDAVVRSFRRIYDAKAVPDDKAAQALAVGLLPIAEATWGHKAPAKSPDPSPAVAAAFDQVAAVRDKDDAAAVAVKEKPVSVVKEKVKDPPPTDPVVEPVPDEVVAAEEEKVEKVK